MPIVPVQDRVDTHKGGFYPGGGGGESFLVATVRVGFSCAEYLLVEVVLEGSEWGVSVGLYERDTHT